MDRVKAKAVEEAKAAVVAARATVEALRGTTAGGLWSKDLDELEEAWTKMQETRAAACASAADKVKAKPKSKK
jgi:hypothetical protein